MAIGACDSDLAHHQQYLASITGLGRVCNNSGLIFSLWLGVGGLWLVILCVDMHQGVIEFLSLPARCVEEHWLAKCPGLRQLSQSQLTLTMVSFWAWGRPQNILPQYKGCLAFFHSKQYSSTLAIYDGFVAAFLYGGGTWRFFSSSLAAFSPSLECKSRNSKKSLKSGTDFVVVLEHLGCS